jgi:ApaG protein
MVTEVTSGVKVSVETFYVAEQSLPRAKKFVFAYRIFIENRSEHTIQLLRRHWFIFDSCGEVSEVEGEGVVGEQPVIAPGDSYRYTSGCHLRSEAGSMKGFYTMHRTDGGKKFKVIIPEFQMIVPYKLN